MVTTVRLLDELHEKLKSQAERKGMTFNAYLLSVLWDMEECQIKKVSGRIEKHNVMKKTARCTTNST